MPTQNNVQARVRNRALEIGLKIVHKISWGKCSDFKPWRKPLLYHGTYESEHTWPGRHHFVKGQGAYCGRYAHETHNHDVWNSNMGGKFKTNSFQDMCFAYKGEINQLMVYGSYWRAEDNREIRNWMYVPVSGTGFESKIVQWIIKLISDCSLYIWTVGFSFRTRIRT